MNTRNTKTIRGGKKRHADFQDPYRRSSNFNKVKPEARLKPRGDGTVKLSKEDEDDEDEVRRTVDELLEDEEE